MSLAEPLGRHEITQSDIFLATSARKKNQSYASADRTIRLLVTLLEIPKLFINTILTQ